MNKTIRFVMVLFFLSIFQGFAQKKIVGSVVDENSKDHIPYVNILIKNSETLNLIDFTSTDERGNFKININKDIDAILIETSIISHLAKNQLIRLDGAQDKYIINFSLQERLTELQEVYIEGVKNPITVKKDTTVYSVVQFKDGSERVVEDLLKKLPGISVGDNGVLKFKGKQVTRVLLDGDNIFDQNYTIGTKNIDSEIVAEVQAIEDYNANPLLKGIKSSDDVAVNLILKKGITDVSGNSEIGLGFDSKKLIKANAISVSIKIKGFSTISFNNTGENFSPYNFLSTNFHFSKHNEFDQRTNNLINRNTNHSNLPDARVSLNSNYFGSLNALYKVNEKLSFRVNYNIFKDKLKQREAYHTIYNIENNLLTISNQENTTKSPLVNSFEYEFIYKINKKSFFTYDGKWDSQMVKENSYGMNNEVDFENRTRSKDVFLTNDLEYTYRINDKSVFQLLGIVSTNAIPQSIHLRRENQNRDQTIDLKKNYVKFQTSILSKKGRNESSFELGYNFIEDYVDSDLKGMTIADVFLENNTYLKSSKFYLNTSYLFKIKKWSFLTRLSGNLYNINLNDSNLKNNYEDCFVNILPKFSIKYYLSKESHLYTDYYLTNRLPYANSIYSGLILTNNRNLTNNDFSFNLFDTHSSTLGYRINDFYNLFQFNVYGSYTFKKYGFVQQLKIDEENSFYTSIVGVTDSGDVSFGLELEKYIHLLKSTFTLNSSYSVNEYQNIVNDSELRNNASTSWFGNLGVRTGFQGNINFENKISFSNSSFKNEASKSNAFTSFQNEFQVKYTSADFQVLLNNQYFKADLSDSASSNLFLDAILSYQPKSSKMKYQIKANNLLNSNRYRSINSSDFSTSIMEHSLQERFVVFSILFKY